MKEITDNQVLNVEEVVTSEQTATVKTCYGPLNRIDVRISKNTLVVNEIARITFQWQKFNLATDNYEDDQNSESIQLQVNGQTETLDPVNGSDYVDFSAAEPGVYQIETLNSGVGNTFVEVIVSA